MEFGLRTIALILSKASLLVLAFVFGQIGFGHLFKEDGSKYLKREHTVANLSTMGFTFKPRWEDSKERQLLLRHFCAILGASHIARASACVLSAFVGGSAVTCCLLAEIIFLINTLYAFETFPAGTGAKGSPKRGLDMMTVLPPCLTSGCSGPGSLMQTMLVIATAGMVCNLVSLSWRRTLKGAKES
ncbi:hypothetical protein GUITHDRAFT_145073 [Guillardia theta CCMP2712]|uniref:Uncharacterized protein n=1 Tax=Guillardia theta (strain CCMP2712) TaxID=905079 RepID=L1IMA5_GUITC|nr:hypothetical protein GUITHDRAFT_145073 [Guillardia theta CCMP2712]EKX37376.1 hypothetical protein GUITHDRAFT_145073 [Guillardia theta CCMP2712]|eukprot:XP_005824356.1 hypothetical protein GUITHDRAFT_145073 [Guillardia theta CCMP2712]